ncbi:DMT family transporter [Paenibacillus filicis]|uniref:DMT family transporter n=1 Tax=Paenibacillus filicis TaxID=669464 RepID=A0ABU9DSI2_9BACL
MLTGGRLLAVGAAVFVTLLWSSSYVLNQYAFAEGIGPFTLAGLRYGLAVAALAVTMKLHRGSPKPAAGYAADEEQKKNAMGGKLTWKLYALLGLTGFVLAQGFQYAGQHVVTPTQASMMLSIGNTLMLLLVDALWLRELRSRSALLLILVAMAGVALYNYPWESGQAGAIGIILLLFSCLGYALHTALCRYLLTKKDAAPADLVLKPMLIGAAGMLLTGLMLEGIPPLSVKLLLILLWLGPVNGAVGFTLWAWSQKHLRAYESSLLNNMMLLEVAALDIVMLGRSITGLQAFALVLVGGAILAVQVWPAWKNRKQGEQAQA